MSVRSTVFQLLFYAAISIKTSFLVPFLQNFSALTWYSYTCKLTFAMFGLTYLSFSTITSTCESAYFNTLFAIAYENSL